jgi:hypothetical protein
LAPGINSAGRCRRRRNVRHHRWLRRGKKTMSIIENVIDFALETIFDKNDIHFIICVFLDMSVCLLFSLPFSCQETALIYFDIILPTKLQTIGCFQVFYLLIADRRWDDTSEKSCTLPWSENLS